MACAGNTSNCADLDELNADCDELTEKFTKAAGHLQTLVANVDEKTLLELYGYYKQGTTGPCNISKPSWFNIKGKAKWEAWNKLGNMPQSEAKTLYVQLVEKLDPNYLSAASKEGWVTISTMQSNELELSESEKSLVDYVKEGNSTKVHDVLRSVNLAEATSMINKLDNDGLGLIHWAADRGLPEMLKTIISFGGDVNLADIENQTALHYAASCGHVDCIMVLLKHKADPYLTDSEGLNPKEVATDDAVRELLDNFGV